MVGVLAAGAALAQEPRGAAPRPVRGAHEAVRHPDKVFRDDLGLAVPGTPIDHPARVYPAADDFPTGPAVGERLPDFVLPNQRGERVDFHRQRAGRKAVVVFVRSAVWCSYCITQLVELQETLDLFRSAGFAVYAISYDPQPALRRFAERYHIAYDLLSDEGSAVIRRFGILNTLIDPSDRRAPPFVGIPFPGSYVVNESGVVTEKFFNRHYATRMSSATILDKALGRALAVPEPADAARRGKQATVTATPAGRVMRPEVINTLRVRLDLPPGLHVYGTPLPEGFVPTRVAVRPSHQLRLGAPVYPGTTPRRFEALGVTLPVYDGALTVDVPVALHAGWNRFLDAPARAGMPAVERVSLTVDVDYQACSSTICYPPDRVRLTLEVPTAGLIYPGLQ